VIYHRSVSAHTELVQNIFSAHCAEGLIVVGNGDQKYGFVCIKSVHVWMTMPKKPRHRETRRAEEYTKKIRKNTKKKGA
jgi:hypothetical protein